MTVVDLQVSAVSRPADVVPYSPLVPTIFHEPWWLDAASGGDYQEATVTSGGAVVGRFPYVLRRLPLGLTFCGTPQLAHFLGPAVDDGHGADCNRMLKRDSIVRELLDQMPNTSGFSHKMHAGVSDLLIFQESGFNSSVQFTFEIKPAPTAELWRRMRDKTRNAIRQAQKSLSVSDLDDVDEFVQAYRLNLGHAGIANAYAEDSLVRTCGAALRRDRGRFLAARTADGQLAAAIFYVWDSRVAYYLLTTRTPAAGNGAVSLLLWHAIRDSTERGLTFDFDGVSTHGSRLFCIGFGGQVSPRYTAFKFSFAHRLYDKAVSFAKKGETAKYI